MSQMINDICNSERWEELQTDENFTLLKYAHLFCNTTASSTASNPDLEGRQLEILSRLKILEARIASYEARLETVGNLPNPSGKRGGEPVARVENAIADVLSAQTKWVPENYYDVTIGERRDILSCKIPQMLKTVVVENVACTEVDCKDPTNSRYYAVLVQYASRFNAERLMKLVRGLRPEETRLPRRKFNFQFAPEEVTKKLTGFSKGAVTPFGLLTQIPIILTDKVMDIHPSFIWMGGGHIHLKLGIAIQDFIKKLNPIIGDVAEMRDDNVENSRD